MQPVNITISNELSALPVLQAAVGSFSQRAGAKLSLAREMELVMEEIITNIIKFEYPPGRQESIEVRLTAAEEQLEFSILFKGIPFDIGYLRQCEEVSLTDILSGEAKGIGLHLVRRLCDELQYRNLGKDGQQILILRRFASSGSGPARITEPAATCEEPTPPVQVLIRRMLPEESATVSKLAYFAYNYSYVYDHIYDPDKVRRLNRDQRMVSFVAVDQIRSEIIGHCALLPDEDSGLDELGVAFVNPRYRGGGCLNDLSERLISEAKMRNASGVFVMAVTTHPYSQKAATREGLHESALLLSRVQPIALQAIHDQAVARESLLFMVRPFESACAGEYHPPARHRRMLVNICANIGIKALMADTAPLSPLPVSGSLEQRLDHYQAGHIHLQQYGKDSREQVRRILRGWCLDRLETIYLYLPLLDPATAVMTEYFEEMGFFFSGLQPGRSGNDLLVLQYLNNQRLDYTIIKAATRFGEELIDYVRSCDPNVAENE